MKRWLRIGELTGFLVAVRAVRGAGRHLGMSAGVIAELDDAERQLRETRKILRGAG